MKVEHEKLDVSKAYLNIHDGKIEAKKQRLNCGCITRITFSEPVQDVGLSEKLIMQDVDFVYGGHVFDGKYVYVRNSSPVIVDIEDDDVFVKLPDIEDEAEEKPKKKGLLG